MSDSRVISAGQAGLHGNHETGMFANKFSASPSPFLKPDVPGNGGARRDRTDDLMLAKHALSQLSYGPGKTGTTEILLDDGGPGTTRTSDLTLIRGAL